MAVVWDDEKPQSQQAKSGVIWDDEPPPAPKPESPSMLESLGQKLKQRGKEFYEGAGFGGRNPLMAPEKTLRMGAAAIGVGGDIAGAVLSPLLSHWGDIYTDIPSLKGDHPTDVTQTPLGKTLQTGVKAVSDKYGEWSARNPRLSKDIGAAATVASVLPIGRVAEEIAPEVKAATQGAEDLAKAGKELIKPTPTKEEALGQILQGRTKDIVKGEKAFGTIDTSGVKTYVQLQEKLDQSIPDLARQVDAELAKDPKLYKLNDLSTTAKSAGGSEVKQNFVETALGHLKELYTKINDPVNAKNIDEILQKAETEGLTKKEVNDIARKYGSEFKDKAFSKQTGDPLTSINSQAYENVRSGLKDVARRDMSPAAKELDATMSSIYNTKRLIDKNVEAVRKLRQKVDQRGIGEKLGGMLANTIDTLSLGSAKGFVQKMFPRNVGYKMKNWLDLEKSLERNLKLIDRATEANTNKEMRRVIFEIRKEIKALPPGKGGESWGLEAGKGYTVPEPTQPRLSTPQPMGPGMGPTGTGMTKREMEQEIFKRWDQEKRGVGFRSPQGQLPPGKTTFRESGTPLTGTPKSNLQTPTRVNVEDLPTDVLLMEYKRRFQK